MITASILEDVQKKHPNEDLEVLEHSDEEIIVKPPGKGEYRAYKAMIADEKQRAGANEALLFRCVVYPDAAGLNALLARKPGLADTFGNELATMSGLAAGCSRKKLSTVSSSESSTPA